MANGLQVGGFGGSSGTLPTRMEATVSARHNGRIKNRASIVQFLPVVLDIHRPLRGIAGVILSRLAVCRVRAPSPPWRRSFFSRIVRF